MFWTVWISPFKRETVLKAFEATGIWPKDRNAILKRFHPQTPDEDQSTSSSPSLSEADFKNIREVVQSVVKERADKEAKKVTQAFHHLQVQNELLHCELEGLREASTTKKKHKKKGKALNFQQRQEYHDGAVFWSPRKMRETRA